MCAGRCGVSPVLSGFSNGKILLPQNGSGTGTTAFRARRQPSPPDGRQKLRQAGGAPNRKFPATPAAAPAGFDLSKRAASKYPTPCKQTANRRRCNGVSTDLQSPLQSAAAKPYFLKTTLHQKTPKPRRNSRYSAQCVAMPLRRSFFAMRLSRLPMMLTNGQFSRPLCLRNQVERGREDRRSLLEFLRECAAKIKNRHMQNAYPDTDK